MAGLLWEGLKLVDRLSPGPRPLRVKGPSGLQILKMQGPVGSAVCCPQENNQAVQWAREWQEEADGPCRPQD